LADATTLPHFVEAKLASGFDMPRIFFDDETKIPHRLTLLAGSLQELSAIKAHSDIVAIHLNGLVHDVDQVVERLALSVGAQ
jgi:hypothetical protein